MISSFKSYLTIKIGYIIKEYYGTVYKASDFTIAVGIYLLLMCSKIL